VTTRKEYAVTCVAPEKVELREEEREIVPPGPNEITGSSVVTLISPGTELAAVYRGRHFPSVGGYAAVMRVEAVGEGVTDVKPGDLVFGMGAHRSHQRLTRREAVLVPPGLVPKVAVFARMMGVTMSTLTTTAARPPEPVVVTGLGLVGNLGAQVFQSCGYRVTACDPLENRRKSAVSCGLRDVRAGVPLDDPAVCGKVGLVLECSGHERAVLEGCRVVRKRGEVALVGAPWQKRTDISAHEILHEVFHRYVILRSGWEWEVPRQPTDFMSGSVYNNFAAALEWLAQGRIAVEGLYEVVAPRDGDRAYRDLDRRDGEILARVFDWSDCP